MLERFKSMDCHQALRTSKALTSVGVAMGFLGIAIGAMVDSVAVMVVIAVLAAAIEICGIVLGVRRVRCPKCAAFLGDMPRLPSEIPHYCPRCGGQL